MKKLYWMCIVLGAIHTTTFAQPETYYTRNATQGGFWNLDNSWTTNPDGSGGPAGPPEREDHIVILNNHKIIVSAIDENGFSGVSPDNVTDPDGNIGPFLPQSGVDMFYHTGDITINSGGDLEFTVDAMLAGNTTIEGDISTDIIVILGILNVAPGSSATIGNDLILSGNSESNININALSVDDFFLDHSDALLCGTNGSITLQGDIKSFNGADPDDQVCTGFDITCTDNDCCNEEMPLICGCEPECTDGTFEGSGSFLLPVELAYFRANTTGNSVQVKWATYAEINNDYFTIERSTNGTDYYEISTVSGSGNSNEFTEYTFMDTSPLNGTSYYRLKQTDYDGQNEYLDLTYVHLTGINAMSVFPNPSRDQLNISLDYTPDTKSIVYLYNVKGEMVLHETFKPFSGDIVLDESFQQLPKGVYYLKFMNEDKQLSTKVIKE